LVRLGFARPGLFGLFGLLGKKEIMSRVILSLSVLLLATLTISCGSSSQLEGLTLGDIQIEGEHAEDVKADLEKALLSAGATLHQADQPNLVGTLTWEWAGEGETTYPTLIKIFMQSDPTEKRFTISSQYKVEQGAQPRDVTHYRGQLVERIVSRLAAQSRTAS